MSATTPVTRKLNRLFKNALPEGTRIQASIIGSFLSIRIEGPTVDQVTVQIANLVVVEAGKMFVEMGGTKDIRPLAGINWHMDGVVANWQRA